jgi:hypothetical protein
MQRKILLLLIAVAAAQARDRIAFIEFFGYKGIDVEAIRRALPFHEGDPFTDAVLDQTVEAVHRLTGKDPTDVNPVCCVGDGDWALFIGLPGASSHNPTYNPKPTRDPHLPSALTPLYERMKQAELAAVKKGTAEEDGAPGYRLTKDPAARAAELEIRAYALRHPAELIRVLRDSSRKEQRAIAADVLGYAARSPRQIAALEYAAHDPDASVRNDAIRALGEILRAGVSAAPVRLGPFIEMLNSPTWSDRNKSSMVLLKVTESRDPQLLSRLKSEAGEGLLEMARWRADSWAFSPRVILARIAGFPEARVTEVAFGPLPAFFEAIHHE